MDLDYKTTVGELLTHHPSAINVFLRGKMLCVGCPTETFHTLEDVARIYGIAVDQLLQELRAAIEAQDKTGVWK